MTDTDPTAALAPTTEAGRALHERLFGVDDRLPDGKELDTYIVAIEDEARAQAAADHDRQVIERYLASPEFVERLAQASNLIVRYAEMWAPEIARALLAEPTR